jgi:hypothetical protein
MDIDVFASVEGADLQRLGDVAAGLGAPKSTWKGAATLSAHVTGIADGDQPVMVERPRPVAWITAGNRANRRAGSAALRVVDARRFMRVVEPAFAEA